MLPIHEDRWKKWRRMDLWSLSDAVALWNMWNPDGHYDKQMIDAFDSFSIKPLRDLAIAAIRSGNLNPHLPCNDPADAFFAPTVFIQWAKTKGVPVPAWWNDFLGEAEETEDVPTLNDKPMGTRERRTHQVIIAALCQKNRIDPRSRDAVARLVALTEETGACVGEDTIRKILKELPESIELRMK